MLVYFINKKVFVTPDGLNLGWDKNMLLCRNRNEEIKNSKSKAARGLNIIMNLT